MNRKLEPLPETFAVLLDAFYKTGDIPRAEALLTDIKKYCCFDLSLSLFFLN